VDVTPFLLQVLVGGYVFANTCNPIRYRTAREDGHRLYFRATFYGVCLFFAALLLRLWLISDFDFYREWEQGIRDVIRPILKDTEGDSWIFLVVSVWTLILGSTIAGPLNRLLFPKSSWLITAIQEDDLESLFHRALARAMPVALTMENAKVYVGFVVKTYEPRLARKHLRILPLMSGYRAESGKVNFTTFYDSAYKKINVWPNGVDGLSLEDFELVLPIDKVQSANLFDVETYNQFQTAQSQAGTGRAGGDPRKAWRAAPAAPKRTSLWTR